MITPVGISLSSDDDRNADRVGHRAVVAEIAASPAFPDRRRHHDSCRPGRPAAWESSITTLVPCGRPHPRWGRPAAHFTNSSPRGAAPLGELVRPAHDPSAFMPWTPHRASNFDQRRNARLVHLSCGVERRRGDGDDALELWWLSVSRSSRPRGVCAYNPPRRPTAPTRSRGHPLRSPRLRPPPRKEAATTAAHRPSVAIAQDLEAVRARRCCARRRGWSQAQADSASER